jgi:quercetin dioxygenase-like cupin family protein
MPASVFVRSSDVVWESLAAGMTRQVLGHGDDMMLVRVAFERDSIGALHHHPHRQASHVIEGRFEVTVGEEVAELGPGDSFYAGSNVPHAVKALESGVLLDVFTPIRDDFLLRPA